MGEGSTPCVRLHRKLEPTDVILLRLRQGSWSDMYKNFNGMWTSSVHKGGQSHVDVCGQMEGDQKPNFLVDVINV